MPTYTEDEMNTWPDDSYYGRERDLADLLDNDTMEFYHTMKNYGYDIDESGIDTAAWHIFNLLMMHKAAFLAMLDHLVSGDAADALALRLQIQADANENSGDAFAARLAQRYTHWNELQNIISKF